VERLPDALATRAVENSPSAQARIAGESSLPGWPASIREKNMTRRGWYCAVVAVAVLFGCQAYRPDEGGERKIPSLASLQKQECHNTGTCQVDVDVGCVAGLCSAVVDPKVLLINGGQSNQVVMWTLNAPAGFDFPDDGVSFASVGFDCVKESPQKFKCTNPSYTKGVFVYTVKVRNSATGNLLIADPWIVNN
jgi:hypothetical protein